MNWVQILDEFVCISHGANTLEKGMNATLLPHLVKIVGQTGFFNLGMATGLEGKIWIQTC